MLTDLHCHLLWGIDDGPETSDGSLAIANLLVSLGFGTVAATPHALPQFADRKACAERLGELAHLLAQEGVPLELAMGAESRLDEDFLERELAGAGLHYGVTRYALVEAPFDTVVPALPDILFRLSRKGVRPVLAHPERCAEFQQLERAEQAVRLGAALQLDLGSLAGTYGRQAKKVALALLEAGLYSIAATDVHEAGGARKWLPEGMAELEKRAGRSVFERLLGENPARLLRGEELV